MSEKPNRLDLARWTWRLWDRRRGAEETDVGGPAPYAMFGDLDNATRERPLPFEREIAFPLVCVIRRMDYSILGLARIHNLRGLAAPTKRVTTENKIENDACRNETN